jgi:hypothetical protein
MGDVVDPKSLARVSATPSSSTGLTGLRTLVRGNGPNEVAGGPERTGCTSSSAAGV